MCLIIVAWKAHPDYPLVVAANRDEYFARPTQPAHWWAEHPILLAGKDLQAGGTWMGVSRTGRFAALTNYREGSQQTHPHAPSRGLLVRDALIHTQDTVSTLSTLTQHTERYAGFNLLVSDGNNLGIYESTRHEINILPSGIYGLSNHMLNTPWPKVKQACQEFSAALPTLPEPEAFLALLRDRSQAKDNELPKTGVPLEWERLLSPIFIEAPGYGTRSSTLLFFDRNNQCCFHEWCWNENAELDNEAIHRFKLTST